MSRTLVQTAALRTIYQVLHSALQFYGAGFRIIELAHEIPEFALGKPFPEPGTSDELYRRFLLAGVHACGAEPVGHRETSIKRKKWSPSIKYEEI